MNLPFQCGSVNGVMSSQRRSNNFDRMGNRLSLTQGSGAEAITKQTPFGSINQSQQPTLVLHGRKVELTGQVAAGETAQVTFNGPGLGQTADPRGFRATTQIPGTEGMMLRTLVSSGGTEKAGYLYVPSAEEVLGYDLWGNLIRDARWEYTWDGNNRFVDLWERHAEANATLEAAYPFRLIRLAYDHLGRRIAKTVWVWVPSQIGGNNAWRLEKDLRYVYDGWQMIAELDRTFAQPGAWWLFLLYSQQQLLDLLGSRSLQEAYGGFTGISGVAAERSVVRTYLWGQDLSGTMTGAGGVGGLLSVTHQGVTYHTCSDANGNITGLLAANGADAGQLIARFDYDPFGNRLTNTGPDVEICPMGFSSKYTDSETGQVYYGFRYYSPKMGRFLSRDPMYEITGEHPELMEEGPNLYGFVHNDPVNGYDFLGLKWKKVGKTKDERRLIWERDDPAKDTMEELAKKVDLDPKEASSWAKPDEKNSCRYTTPNVWIMVKMLHGIHSFRDIYTNPGDEIGDLFTFTGSRKTVNVSTSGAIASTINQYRGDIIGLSIYGHGSVGAVGGTAPGDTVSQASILSAVDGNGFKLKEAHLMQCYSGAGGYDAKWKTRCYKGRATVYYGMNVCGFETGSKP